MLVLVERFKEKYAGENVPMTVTFEDIVLHEVPKLIDMEMERCIAMQLKRYVSKQTAMELFGNLNQPSGDYTLCYDEKKKSYTLVMMVDVIVSVDTEKLVTLSVPAVLFQLSSC